ncbi:hypothetical protein ACJ73_00356 [Blastomyces percursus]|uniref:MULE transposase domain-containing protein n=1 Tax=Blastomyces percursus TaxID=1658174 RepID=A0A1J9QHD8_9EURO|nr:hypothetical protein ACJ73_00356 [Blastomyces percursus]
MSQDHQSHPVHRLRALDAETRSVIYSLVKAMMPARSIRTILSKRLGDEAVTARDLYNLTAQLLREDLKGRTPIQALIDEFTAKKDGNIVAEWKTDHENRITHLALFHRQSIEYLRENHDILLLDSTYKTNRYRLPLLSVIFVTKLHTTLNLGFTFMNSEKEADYK